MMIYSRLKINGVLYAHQLLNEHKEDWHQFAHLHSPISSLTTKNIDNRKISREDQYQPVQSDRTLCWLLCRRPVVEVQQTGHVNQSFIVINF